MPAPRVFVSSTCYDLRYIRENLSYFITNMGFEPVLSEKGNIFYNPSMHIQDTVLNEVSNCQLFVLIIGGRFGNKFKEKRESIVNHEYRKAIDEKIPVFALVEESIYSEYKIYLRNKGNSVNDKILYSEVDSTKIFDFMEEVQSNAFNNALYPFSNYIELESYLRQQWAGLMYDLLAKKSSYERESELFEKISHIEFLSKQILNSVGQDPEKINNILYEKILQSELKKLEKNLSVKFSPTDVIESKTVEELFSRTGISISRHLDDIELMPWQKNYSAIVPVSYFNSLTPDYERLRQELLNTLDHYGWSIEKFLAQTKMPKIGRKNNS